MKSITVSYLSLLILLAGCKQAPTAEDHSSSNVTAAYSIEEDVERVELTSSINQKAFNHAGSRTGTIEITGKDTYSLKSVATYRVTTPSGKIAYNVEALWTPWLDQERHLSISNRDASGAVLSEYTYILNMGGAIVEYKAVVRNGGPTFNVNTGELTIPRTTLTSTLGDSVVVQGLVTIPLMDVVAGQPIQIASAVSLGLPDRPAAQRWLILRKDGTARLVVHYEGHDPIPEEFVGRWTKTGTHLTIKDLSNSGFDYSFALSGGASITYEGSENGCNYIERVYPLEADCNDVWESRYLLQKGTLTDAKVYRRRTLKEVDPGTVPFAN